VTARGEALADHLGRPRGRGHIPADACTGAAGGAACGDLVRVSLSLDAESADGRIADAGFDAQGCGAMIAAGSAAVKLVRGTPLLAAARVGAEQIAQELGGLGPSKRHAAELAADALARALGSLARERARLAHDERRTLVAMSGGVDSAVAALLLAREGAHAVAVTLELWSDVENDEELSCCSARAVRRARALAHTLGLSHLSIDLRAEFRAGVVEKWLAGHAAGETPNPCVRCNGSVRLDAMLEIGERLGARTLATGHYARVHHVRGAPPLLRVAADERKDQSYALAALAPESLARMRFPLGELHKPQVRELALRDGLEVAARRDSQDLCFLAGTRASAFLERHAGLSRRPGPIVDDAGRVLGEHGGVHTVTVGQRRGLGVAAREPLYVLASDASSNTVTVGPREALRTRAVRVRELVLHRDGAHVDGVRMRAHGSTLPCSLRSGLRAGRHAGAVIELGAAAERTAAGQLACLYAGELVVGYGTICA
jgi:tRNA-specific 2-thiouridylase